MSENAGLHVDLTANSGNFTAAMERARQQLAGFAVEQTKLRAAIQAAEKELAEQSKKFGKDSEEAKKAAKALEQLYKENLDLKGRIQDVTNSVNKQTQAFAKNAKQGNDTANQLKSAFTMLKGLALGYAGKTLFSALVGSNAEFEQSMTSFEVLLGSADKAQSMLNDLTKFAAETPLEMADVTDATTMLLGYQVAAEDVLDILSRLGDLARGDAERLDRITLAYGQMLAKGKVTGEELRQMVEAQVPLTQALADTMGITTAELSKLLETGQVGIPELNATIKAMTDEGGAFFGMMEKQAKTASGMLSTLKDDVNIFARQVGEESFNYLKTEMSSLMAEIDRMSASGELQAIAEDIGEDIAGAVELAAGLLKILFDMKDVIIAGTAGVITYKASFALLTAGISAFNAVKETFNIITGKSVVVKNLETGATYTLTKAQYDQAAAAGVAMKAQTGLNAALGANPVMAVVSAFAALVSILIVFNKTGGESASRARELKKEFDELTASHKAACDSIYATRDATVAQMEAAKKLVPELEELSNKTNRTEEENARLDMIIDQLNEAFPDLALAVDNETGALNRQIGVVYDAAEAYIALAKAKAMQNILTENEEQIYRLRLVRDEQENALLIEQDAARFRNPSNYRPFRELGSVEDYGTKAAELALKATNKEIDKLTKDNEKLVQEITELAADNQKTVDALGGGQTNSGDYSGGSRIGTSTSSAKSSSSGSNAAKEAAKEEEDALKELKEAAEAALEALDKAHDDWLNDAESYISQRNFYNDWEKQEDTEEKALERMLERIEYDHADRQERLEEFYSQQLLTQEEYQEASAELYRSYSKELEDVNQRLFTLAKEDFEAVLDSTAEAMKQYYNAGKVFEQSVIHMEMQPQIAEAEQQLAKVKREYASAEESIEQQMRELEEKLAAFERATEDEDDETRRQRLAYRLEYEHDEDNQRALEKELEALDKEIAEKNFKREVEEQMAAYEEEQRQLDELYEREIGYIEEVIEARRGKEERLIEELEARYEQAMSMENVTQEMYNYLTQNEDVLESIGSLMGEQMVDGLSQQLDGYLAAVKERLAEYGLNPNGSLGRSFADRIISQNNSRNYNLTIQSGSSSSAALVHSGQKLMDEIELRSSL